MNQRQTCSVVAGATEVGKIPCSMILGRGAEGGPGDIEEIGSMILSRRSRIYSSGAILKRCYSSRPAQKIQLNSVADIEARYPGRRFVLKTLWAGFLVIVQ